jgi:hypothetical protein
MYRHRGQARAQRIETQRIEILPVTLGPLWVSLFVRFPCAPAVLSG